MLTGLIIEANDMSKLTYVGIKSPLQFTVWSEVGGLPMLPFGTDYLHGLG